MVNKFRLGTLKQDTTKEAISRSLEIADQYAGELSIEVLSLEKIEIDPENNRELSLTLNDAINGIQPQDPLYEAKKQDWKSLESLAKTIRDDQLINPIYVYRYGNKCRLIAGERRTLASAIAGKKEIIARIASQRPVGTKLKILQWIENNERLDLSLGERLASIEAILKEYFSENINHSNKQQHLTSKLLSDLTGMSVTQARRYILILQAKPEIKQAIIEGKIENIKVVEIICSAKNIENQNELLKSALIGFSFEALCRLKQDLEQTGHRKKISKGRKKINIKLGHVKPETAKFIINALISSNDLHSDSDLAKDLKAISEKLVLNDHSSIEEIFKRIIIIIDKGIRQYDQ